MRSRRPAGLVKGVIDRVFAVPAAYRLRQILVQKGSGGVYGRLLGELVGRNVLELGCGPGTNLSALAAAGSYLGIDVNPRYIETARRRHPERAFATADARRFTPDRHFDLVLIDSLLHHLDDGQVASLLGRAGGWLTADGAIVVHEPLTPAPRELFHRILMKLDRGDYFRQLDHWQALTTSAGLEVVELVIYEQRIVTIGGYRMAGMKLAGPRLQSR